MSKTWAKCLNTLKDTIPIATYSVWVQPLKAIEDDTNLSLLAPSSSVKNYVNKNLKHEIKSVVAQHNRNLKVYMLGPQYGTIHPYFQNIRLTT